MRLHRLCVTVAALAAATLQLPAHAERTPARPLPLAESTASSARVIVKFREDATLVRAHALAVGGAMAQVANATAARASSLGARHGVLLRAGAAITERSQVMQADGIGSRELAARLALDPDVEYAEPDRRVRRVAVPNDPLFTTVSGSQGPASGQWYLRAPAGEVQSAINAVTAWDRHTGNPAVIVAVLDTGVRSDHPDLAGKLLPGYDVVSDTNISNDGTARDADASDPGDWLTQAEINAGISGDPNFWDGCEASDSSWHGTQVSGIVAAATQNSVGMAGSGRHVRVLPVRVLGKCFGYVSDIVAGMRWAAGLPVSGLPANPNPAKVINLSLGSGGACTQSEADAVTGINAAGAVVVAAAGNSAGRAAGSPANCAGAIGVAGVRHVGSKVGFSDVGPELSIAAPGGNCVNLSGACLYPILTTVNNGAQGPATNTYSDGNNNVSVGTSFSAPLVSGTAALLYSVRAGITAAQVRSALQSSARPFPSSGLAGVQVCQAPGSVDQLECYCTTTTCGAGMLDADGAVRAVLGASGMLEPVVVNQTTSPQAGAAVTLTSGSSVVPGGRSIVARRWSLVQGGGSVSAFSGVTDGETVSMTPGAAGAVTVQLALTDDRGLSTATDFSFTVAAAAGQPSGGGGGGGSGGGGGAMSWAWLLGLAFASLALLTTGRRKPA
jgi:serine protease